MASGRKRQQTIAKRNRERAVEEKRTLKRLAKQARREAARNGELDEQPLDEQALGETDETDETDEPGETEEPEQPKEPEQPQEPG